MPIRRDAQTVAVARYAVSVVLVPRTGFFKLASPAFGAVPPQWPSSLPECAFIPSFQRGIEWTAEHAQEVVEKSSEVIGTTTWGRFPWNRHPYPPELPTPTPADAIFLTDGLQRFATITALLNLLDKHGFLNDGSSAHCTAKLDAALSKTDIAIYRFNHHVLGNYARPTLALNYKDFYHDLDVWVTANKTDMNWADRMQRFMLESQIGIDIYTGFASDADLARHFIALNTGRIELQTADILRAVICEDGLNSNPPWAAADTLGFDTRFNDVVIASDYSDRMQPIVNQIYNAMEANSCRALPSFKTTNGTQLKSETDELLERLAPYTDSKSDLYRANSIPEELVRCGKLPISILAAYDLVHPAAPLQPWYLQAAPLTPPTADLLVLLRAIYRAYLDGVEGRQTEVLLDLLQNPLAPGTLIDIGDTISRRATGGALGIDQPLDVAWIKQRLERVSQRRAPRIFTACELPPAFAAGVLIPTRPCTFTPQVFGTKSGALQIDHLIPQGTGAPTTVAEQTIRNFAPIPQKLNAQCGIHSCRAKLLGIGSPADYASLVAGTYYPTRKAVAVPHPYVEWLVTTHAQNYLGNPADLDNAANLLGNVGDERVEWLAVRLAERV
jgi:hypothetical protein